MRGQIIKWDDEKGFGFIKSNEQVENIFAHVSQFKAKHLRPAVGDVVDFEIKSTKKGLQAVKIEYPNQPSQPLPNPRLHHAPRNNSSFVSTLVKLIIVCGIAFAGFMFYQQYQKDKSFEQASQPVYSENSTNQPSVMSSSDKTAPVENASNSFKCDGRQYCSDMRSREEAEFFIKNCPNTKMDGDNDGEPCEGDSRW